MKRDLDRHGIELFNQGRYWEAHEAWEEAWTSDRHGPDRGFYKGLIQIAAGCLHYTRKNRRGTLNKWRSGAAYLGPYLPRHRDFELAPLVALIEGNLAALSAEPGSWPELRLPLIAVAPRREETAGPHPPR
jgi:predicted metal-dependent hydrolase